ncbi:MAG TPA: hypothetical protein VIU15_30915 [Streptomyces sp.]
MSIFGLPHQKLQIHYLAGEFEALHDRVRDVSYTPGVDALRRIGPLLLRAQDLTATVLVRLNALYHSAFPGRPGGGSRLELLASALVASSLANNALALALQANPGEYELSSGGRHGEIPPTAARPAEAILVILGHLEEAAAQLKRSAVVCRRLAADIARELARSEGLQANFARPNPYLRPSLSAAVR